MSIPVKYIHNGKTYFVELAENEGIFRTYVISTGGVIVGEVLEMSEEWGFLVYATDVGNPYCESKDEAINLILEELSKGE